MSRSRLFTIVLAIALFHLASRVNRLLSNQPIFAYDPITGLVYSGVGRPDASRIGWAELLNPFFSFEALPNGWFELMGRYEDIHASILHWQNLRLSDSEKAREYYFSGGGRMGGVPYFPAGYIVEKATPVFPKHWQKLGISDDSDGFVATISWLPLTSAGLVEPERAQVYIVTGRYAEILKQNGYGNFGDMGVNETK